LGGAYFLGNFFGSLIWGIAADKMGRRTVLLIGVSAIILCELFFGFSQNMLWALSARLMWGVLNGNIGVAKTYISEVTTGIRRYCLVIRKKFHVLYKFI